MGGGSDATIEVNDADWTARERTARALKLAIGLAPFVVGAVVSVGVSFALPAPSSWQWALGRIVIIAAASMCTIAMVERVARRLLPLSSLLRLSLVFPDRTPSRFRLALKAGSGRRMERALADARANGLSPDRAQAAEQIVLLSTSIGAHDRRTRGHSERVRLYAELLGEELHLSDAERQRLQWAALIHDLGKITVPPEILNKKGKPSAAEWAVLQNHPTRGEELVAPVADWLGEWVHAVGGHHERWDGTGYPRQLAGHDISRAAAIVAVADSFEVMTAVRSYKSAMSLADARAELTRCSGTHFSPDIVRAFLNISLPRLRRVGGALASLAHVPFLGNAVTIGAKAPEAWGYGLANMANAGSSVVATAAVTGLLVATPAIAGDQQSGAPPPNAVHAAAIADERPASGSGERTTSHAGNDAPPAASPPTTVAASPVSTTRPMAGETTTTTRPDDRTITTTTVRLPPVTVAAPDPLPDVPKPTVAISSTTTRPGTPPTTAPPSTLVSSISQLIALLAPDPDAYGDRGSNLHDKLVDLELTRASYPDSSSKVRGKASDLLDDIDKWLNEGRLDVTIGNEAKRLVAPLVA